MFHNREECKCCRATDDMFLRISEVLETMSANQRRLMEEIVALKHTNERVKVVLDPKRRTN